MGGELPQQEHLLVELRRVETRVAGDHEHLADDGLGATRHRTWTRGS